MKARGRGKKIPWNYRAKRRGGAESAPPPPPALLGLKSKYGCPKSSKSQNCNLFRISYRYSEVKRLSQILYHY